VVAAEDFLPLNPRQPVQPLQPVLSASSVLSPEPAEPIEASLPDPSEFSPYRLSAELPELVIDQPTKAAGKKQRGLASWYGKAFHGKRTANGERFDMHALTAAHRTLPLGTLVRVSRGRQSVVVRVNDRGPYHGNRVLDLSMAAAERLGIVSQGQALIDMEILGKGRFVAQKPAVRVEADPLPTIVVEATAYYLEAGQFVDAMKANEVREQLNQAGIFNLEWRIDDSGTPEAIQSQRLLVGPLADAKEIEALQFKLAELGVRTSVVQD
jgi:rare lipoprotein A